MASANLPVQLTSFIGRKREIAEIACHLATLASDSYDTAIAGEGAIKRVLEEHGALKQNGII